MGIEVEVNKDSNVCNVCGSELDFWDQLEDFGLHKRIGYGSIHDGEKIDLRLCCKCFDKYITLINNDAIHKFLIEDKEEA